MDILVNGEHAGTGTPGSYISIRREWANRDLVKFTFGQHRLQFVPHLAILVAGSTQLYPALDCDRHTDREHQQYRVHEESTFLKKAND
jgi:hypothetical protein